MFKRVVVQDLDFLEASIEFSDSSKQWLTGIPDGEGEQEQNWIRSGTSRNDPQQPYDDILQALMTVRL